MGGFGSGNWYRSEKKRTVEQSMPLSVATIRDSLNKSCSGKIQWSNRAGRRSSIGYQISPDSQTPILTLCYRWRDSVDVSIPIAMQSTPMHFGGRRWWFTCPLIVAGKACRRRVGKLYLPPGSKYFGCRTCHSLSYVSSQTAHQMERFSNQLASLENYVN